MDLDIGQAADADESDTGSSEEEAAVDDASDDIGEAAVVSFDASLPGTHAYLGSDLEDVRGRTLLDDWSYRTMPLLSFSGLVLMPGQMLPLNLTEHRALAVVKQALDTDHTLGVIHTSLDPLGPGMHLLRCAAVGTTAEVCSMKEDVDEQSGISMIRAKAVGRQRFKVTKKWRQIDGVLMARVRILPERELTPALACVAASCCGYGSSTAALWRTSSVRHVAGGRPADEPSPRHKVVQHCLSSMTAWPAWVYRMYDKDWLMGRIRKELLRWSGSLAALADSLPQDDAVQFSYTVASSLPIDEITRLRILHADSAVQRMRIELSLLEKCTSFCCSSCGEAVTSTRDVFSLAREGPMAAYVNAYGHVHETLTVLRAKNLSLSGRSSLENTWFPGYAWTIANCSKCGRHKGWKFSSREAGLLPTTFWGLTRMGLVPALTSSDVEQSQDVSASQ